MKNLKGKVWKLGDNIDTDVILPSRYMNTNDPDVLGSHCLEALIPNVKERISQGDILVAGKNFGCGSSREHAPLAIKNAGFSCVIAESFARIFYRNAINIGLVILTAPELPVSTEEGDVLEVDIIQGLIKNLTSGRDYKFEAFPPFLIDMIEKGGAVEQLAQAIKANQ